MRIWCNLSMRFCEDLRQSQLVAWWGSDAISACAFGEDIQREPTMSWWLTHLEGEHLQDEGGHGGDDTQEHIHWWEDDEGRAGHFEEEAGRIHHRRHRKPISGRITMYRAAKANIVIISNPLRTPPALKHWRSRKRAVFIHQRWEWALKWEKRLNNKLFS